MSRRSGLWGLIRLRRAREQQARRHLGRAQVSAKVAQARIAELQADRARIRPDPATVLRPAQLRALHLQGIRSEEMIDEAVRQHIAARERLAEASDGWKRRAAEVDAAEDLDALRREKAARDARIAADRALDDLTGLLHHREAP